MVATTLSIADMAIIGVNTEDNGNPQRDSITFILLRPIGSGTVIFFTDRTWNGTAFAAASAGENTFTFTAATDLAAGTVVTITQAQLTAAGINLSDAGETVYAYQGAINAPTHFLHAVEIADNVAGFQSNLTNTGLVAGTSAVAITVDNAEFGTRSHNINALEYFRQVNNNTDWVQNDNSPQDGTVHSSGPGTNFTHALVAPDSMILVAGSGAGEAIVTINLDGTYNAGTIGYQIVQAFQNAAQLFHPSDITLDTVNDKYFFVDADLNGNNRIIQGSISELLNNPGAVPTFLVLYSNTGTGAANSMRTISVDIVNQKIYFDLEQAFVRINYNTEGQVPTVLRDLEPIFGANSYITQMTINYATGTVYLGSSSVVSVFGQDFVDANRVFTATGLTGSNAANSMTFTEINWGANGDNSVGPEGSPLGNNHWPVERGTIRGVDVDPATGLLWIVTGTVILDNDGDGFVTYRGGVWTYNPSTGAVVNMYTQNGSTGPVGLLYYIEVDSHTGKYYVVDESGANAVVGDGGVWTGSLTVPGTPTLLATVGNINGLGPQGLEIQHAPTLTGSAAGGLAVTEASSAPNSGETARVTVFTGLTAADVDTLDSGDELRGAVVRVSGNVVLEASSTAPGHAATVDFLRINGLTSGTIAGSGITFNYDPTTGMMVLSGVGTVAEYKAALELVQFSTSGDNVTNNGNALTRTISASVFDGLLYSDEIHATVNVTGINDAPVNILGAAMNFTEDTTGTPGIPAPPPAPVNAITGLSIADPDADATTENFTVTLSVQHGVLNIRTDVTGGLTAGQVTGNGTATLTLTGTQNQINATLAAVNNVAAANGLVYTPAANYNGADTLTMVTNDQGNNGNDPGNSGTGTTEQDSDTLTLNIADVNDAPTVGGDGTEQAADILEDIPSAAGQTVSSLFGGQFSDALDVQFHAVNNPTGSTGDTFAGIAITANGSSGATGQWQYFNGSIWVDIGAASLDAAKTITAATAIRFNPALDFNGAAPTLTARLIESGGPAITNGGTVDLNPAPPTTGPGSVYSSGSVVLSQTVTPVNDAPTSANLQGNSVTWTEGAAQPVLLDLGSNATVADVDSANFDGGTLTVAITGGLVAAEDQLVIRLTGTVSFNATAVFVNGTQIATYAGAGAGGGPLVFTFDADATPAAVAELLRAVAYTNSGGDNPTDGDRTITWTLVDGDGTANGGVDTLTITSTVDVDPVNDAPAGIDGSVLIDEDQVHTFTTADFDFTDVENHALSQVRITTLPSNGVIALNNVAIIAGADIDVADIIAGNLTYTPDANESGTPHDSFTFQVRDAGGTLDGGVDLDATPNTFTFNVTAINDAPVNSVPLATQTFAEDGTLTFNAANSNLISVADVDAGAGDIVVTLAIETGTLTLNAAATGALASLTGDGTNNVVLTGTVAEINAALDGLVYDPGADYNGDRTLTITSNDQGNSGDDPGLTGTLTSEEDQDSIAVDVTAVNDAPTVIGDGTEEAADIVEDTPGAGESVSDLFSGQYSDIADAQFSLSNPGGSSQGAFGGIAVTANGSSVATGQWQYFDGAIWVDIGAASDAAAKLFHPSTLIRFNPALDFNGAAPTLTVHLIDNSAGLFSDGDIVDLSGVGATGGSTPYSTDTVVLSQNVIAANAAPVVDLDADDSSGATGNDFTAAGYTEGGAAVAIADTDVTITDADSGDGDMIEGATITITDALAGDGLTLSDILPGTITVQSGLGSDTLILTGTASAADYQTALTMVRYSSSSDDPTAGGTDNERTITVTVTDGDDSAAATTTVTITGVNDAPAGTDATITAFEDTHRILAEADFGFTDPDSADALGSVIITGVTGGKIFFDADGAGGADPVEVTIFPTDEYSAADLAAGKLTFLGNANLNGTGAGSITFQVVDDSGAANDTDLSANTLTVDITPINDSPVVPNSPTIGVDEQTTITINSSITVSDVDLDALNGGAGDYAGASFAINQGTPSADDVFNFDVTGALFTVNGNDLEAGGLVFATFSQSGGILNIDFTSSGTAATTALVNDVLQHLQYTNTSDDPPASVTLLYVLDDGAPDAVQGALGAPFNNIDGGQVTIDINAINDAPVNSLGGSIGTGEDAIDAWLSGMSISDPDADPANDDIDVTFDVDNGTLGIRTDVVGGITAGDIVSQTATTISVRATLNEINATLAAANGLTYSPDLNFNGDDTLTVTTNDRGFTGADPGLTGDATSEEAVDTRTISVSAVDDPALAADDANDVDEDDVIVGASVLGNDSDVDGPTLTVTEVNGSSVDVGNEITLASGAKLTMRSDGTYDYDPNDQFNTLTDTSSGAVNTSDTDSFTYTLANGNTATVTITVNGVISPEDLLFGDATDNVITGPATNDTFLMMDGGDDTVTGNGGNDFIFFGASLTAADSVDGGAGTDTLALLGDYNMTLGAGQLTGIERLVLRSGTPGGGSPVDYALATTDGAVAAGTTLVVVGSTLTAAEQLIFNGLAETNGHFTILGGAAGDILVGGQLSDNISGGAGDDQLYGRGGNDHLHGGLGADYLRGGAGADVFHYTNANESTALSMDTIADFQAIDHISLAAIDADGNAGNGDTAFTFIGSAAFTNTAGELRATESGGVWTVEGDINGDGVADLVIQVNTVDPTPLTSDSFFL